MNTTKKKFILIGSVFLVSAFFIFYLASFVVPKVLTTVSKASAAAKVSVNNSFMIGEKIMAKADGIEECVVNVFAVDTDGKGIMGKQVQLSGLGDQIGKTDSLGKVTFKLNSTVAKQYELSANIGGATLGKTLTVTFR